MKKIILLFTVLFSVLTFSSCADLNNDEAVAYSIGSLAGTWTGETEHCKLIQNYLIKNGYQIEGLSYRVPVDDKMIKLFDSTCETLNEENKKGDLMKVLHDQDIKGGQITFDYGLLKSGVGTMKKIHVIVNY